MEDKKKRSNSDIYFTRENVVQNGVSFPIIYTLIEDIDEKPIVLIMSKNATELPEKLYVECAHFSRGKKYYKCGAVYVDCFNKYYDSVLSAYKECELVEAVGKKDFEKIKKLIASDF